MFLLYRKDIITLFKNDFTRHIRGNKVLLQREYNKTILFIT